MKSNRYEHILTPRQHEIIRLISAGQSSKQVADTLSISEGTVEAHRFDILKRLGCNSMVHAVARYSLP